MRLWSVFLAMGVAACIGGVPGPLMASPVRAESLIAGLSAASDALDLADKAGFLDAVSDVVSAQPADVSALIAAASLMAPWMAADVLTQAMQAVAEPDRTDLAAEVLAAVLIALDGAGAPALLAAVKAASPQADRAILDDIASRLTILGRATLSVHTVADVGGETSAGAAILRGRGAAREAARMVSRLMGAPPLMPVGTMFEDDDLRTPLPGLAIPPAEPRPASPFLVPSPS